MLKNVENNGMEETGLGTPIPDNEGMDGSGLGELRLVGTGT